MSPSSNDMNKALFVNLVMMLSSSAMQQLGKLVNPMTQKAEVDLEMAQLTIDMLSMIKAKTDGNLDEEEAKLLTNTLSALQMNYVETQKAENNKPSASAEASADEEAGDREPEASEEKSSEDEESDGKSDEDKPNPKDPKFHKSYDEK